MNIPVFQTFLIFGRKPLVFIFMKRGNWKNIVWELRNTHSSEIRLFYPFLPVSIICLCLIWRDFFFLWQPLYFFLFFLSSIKIISWERKKKVHTYHPSKDPRRFLHSCVCVWFFRWDSSLLKLNWGRYDFCCLLYMPWKTCEFFVLTLSLVSRVWCAATKLKASCRSD